MTAEKKERNGTLLIIHQQRLRMHLRLTTRFECRIALSTISGPQTKVAPCFRAKRRVGTII